MRLVRLRCDPCGARVGYLEDDDDGYRLTFGDPRRGRGDAYAIAGLDRLALELDCPHCRRGLLVDRPAVAAAIARATRDGTTRTVRLRSSMPFGNH